MTVLHLISSEGLYGAESMLVLLGRNLKRHGCRPIIGVFRDSRNPHTEIAQRADAAGLETEIIPCRGRLDRLTVQHIRKLLGVRNIDLIHSHGYKTNLYGYAAAWPARRPLVATCHAWQGQHDLRMRMYAVLDRFLLRRFDRLAAVSEVLANSLRASGVDSSSVTTISNAVEVEPTAEPRARLRAELNAGHLVGMVARLSPEKGGDVLLRAAPAVLAEFPDTKFVVVGDGPCRSQWESLAAQLGIAASVVFTGVRTDMPEVYASLDAIALPSFNEGMPMCLLEAMAAGLPVIATPVGAVPKLITHGRTGLLVKPGDTVGLAQGILQLLRDLERAGRLGRSGRSHIEEHFSPEVMTTRYLELYQAALKDRTGRKLGAAYSAAGQQ